MPEHDSEFDLGPEHERSIDHPTGRYAPGSPKALRLLAEHNLDVAEQRRRAANAEREAAWAEPEHIAARALESIARDLKRLVDGLDPTFISPKRRAPAERPPADALSARHERVPPDGQE